MNITFFSHTYIGSPFVVGSHQLAKQFVLLGHDVVHISHPISYFHLILGRAERISQNGFKDGQLFQFTPNSIFPLKWMLRMGLSKLAGIMLWLMIPRGLRKKIADSDLILIDDPSFYALCRYIGKSNIFYRPTDNYSAMEGRYIEKAERELLELANGVIVTHPDLELKFKSKFNYIGPVQLVENGVDLNVFDETAPAYDLNRVDIKFIYVGSLDQRFDNDILDFLKIENDNFFVEIYSPDCKDLCREGNVFYKGTVSFFDVPKVIATADILIMPFVDSEANRTRSPMKLYEYASSGLPIVMPDFMDAKDVSDVYQYKASDVESFKLAVNMAIVARKSGMKKRVLDKHSWYGKAQIIEEFCKRYGR